MRASLGVLVALACALSFAGCKRSSAAAAAAPPETSQRPEFPQIRQCMAAPVDEPADATSPVK